MNTLYIEMREIKELFLDAMKYRALDCGGVDNWGWYEESLNDFAHDKGYDSWADLDDDMENAEIEVVDVYVPGMVDADETVEII